MGNWEYCYVLQYPDDTGVFFFQEGDNEQAKKSPEQSAPSGRQVIDELGKNGWETILVSAVREAPNEHQKKPTYKWVLKRQGDQSQPRPKIATD
jgi:hypothetical protein